MRAAVEPEPAGFTDEPGAADGFPRRRFLGGAAAAALVAGVPAVRWWGGQAATGAGAPAASVAPAAAVPAGFRRLLGDLPPFFDGAPGEDLRQALLDIGRPGGVMDAGDDLAAGAATLALDPVETGPNADHPSQPAGTTFLGQLIGHDLTFDTASRLGTPTDPEGARNERTPVLDLDTIYGGGPATSPQLYQRADPAKFRVERSGRFEDLPRDADGRAVLADPRNDENVIIAGLTAALLRFHNAVVDVVRDEGRPGDPFDVARRTAVRHYQWIVVTEYLPAVLGEVAAEGLLAVVDRRLADPSAVDARIPVEFQASAFRFGHSQIRPAYRVNLAGDDGGPFLAMIFDPAGDGQADPVDLRGGARAPRRFVGWQSFFDFGDGQVLPNKRIDAVLSSPLFRLPVGAIFPTGEPPVSLATRDLLRQVTWSLPSGQSVARALGVEPLASGDLSDLAGHGLDLDTSTPLSYYLLREAAVVEDGRTLGPAGRRIALDAFAAVLAADPDAYPNAPGWEPTLPDRSGRRTGHFTMADLLALAGVDPAHRGE